MGILNSSNSINVEEEFVLKYMNNSKWMENNYNYFNSNIKTNLEGNHRLKSLSFSELYDYNKIDDKLKTSSFTELNCSNKFGLELEPTPLEDITDTELNQLPILRSHQSGSYTIKNLLEGLSICQYLNVYNQLVCGARMLDLRPGMYENDDRKERDLYSGHGPHRGEKLEIIYSQILKFIQENTKEVVIIELQKAHGLGDSYYSPKKKDCERIIHQIKDYFSKYLLTLEDLESFNKKKTNSSERKHSFVNLTYKELVHDINKRIIVIINTPSIIASYYKSETAAEKEGFFSKTQYILGEFANTSNPVVTVENSEKWYQKKDPHKFLNYAIQLTPQHLIDDVYDLHVRLHEYVHKKKTKHQSYIYNNILYNYYDYYYNKTENTNVFHYNSNENSYFIEWLIKEYSKHRINVIGLDFIDVYPAVTEFLICKKMSIFKLLIKKSNNYYYHVNNKDMSLIKKEFVYRGTIGKNFFKLIELSSGNYNNNLTDYFNNNNSNKTNKSNTKTNDTTMIDNKKNTKDISESKIKPNGTYLLMSCYIDKINNIKDNSTAKFLVGELSIYRLLKCHHRYTKEQKTKHHLKIKLVVKDTDITNCKTSIISNLNINSSPHVLYFPIKFNISFPNITISDASIFIENNSLSAVYEYNENMALKLFEYLDQKLSDSKIGIKDMLHKSNCKCEYVCTEETFKLSKLNIKDDCYYSTKSRSTDFVRVDNIKEFKLNY